MRITINNYNKTYSVETDEDVDAESLADMFKGLMISMGYHPSNVDELFNTEYKCQSPSILAFSSISKGSPAITVSGTLTILNLTGSGI